MKKQVGRVKKKMKNNSKIFINYKFCEFGVIMRKWCNFIDVVWRCWKMGKSWILWGNGNGGGFFDTLW